MSNPVRDARRRIRTEHAPVVDGIDDCADRVVDRWDTDLATDRDAVVGGLRSALEAADLLERLPAVLADAVDATGCELPAQPIPAPPYVVVTSRGPLLRATIDPGRLVIRFDAFEIVRSDRRACYRRRDGVDLVVELE